MKKDLTHLLRREEPLEGFEDIESATRYVARYLLSFMNIELEGLPKEEWGKTVETWMRMCAFANALVKKTEAERVALYDRYKFDMMLRGIIEDLRKTIIGFRKLGLLKESDPPQNLILKAVSLVEDREDLIQENKLDPEKIRFIREKVST